MMRSLSVLQFLDEGYLLSSKYALYGNGQLVWTPALGLYLCVFLCVHVTSNVELRNITSDCY